MEGETIPSECALATGTDKYAVNRLQIRTDDSLGAVERMRLIVGHRRRAMTNLTDCVAHNVILRCALLIRI